MELNTTSQSFKVVLAAAVTTNAVQWNSNYSDSPGSNGNDSGNVSGTTQVTLVPSPSASTTRTVSEINVYNADTSPATASISFVDGSTVTTLTTTTMQPGQSMHYDGTSWGLVDTSASSQYTSSTNPTGSANGDLSGNYPNPTVSVLNGVAAPPTTPTTGQVFTATSNGTSAWATPGSVGSGVASLSGATFTGAFVPAVSALTDGSSISVNASLGNVYTLTLGGNHTLANPSNATDGQVIRVLVKQDSTGSRTLSYGTAYDFSGSLPSPTLSTIASVTDSLSFAYSGASSKWLFTSFVPGFS